MAPLGHQQGGHDFGGAGHRHAGVGVFLHEDIPRIRLDKDGGGGRYAGGCRSFFLGGGRNRKGYKSRRKQDGQPAAYFFDGLHSITCFPDLSTLSIYSDKGRGMTGRGNLRGIHNEDGVS